VREITTSDQSPSQIFEQIRKIFEELGVLGRMISIEYDGVRYRISCDEKAFMVYRVNHNTRLRHHVPGWPVCLVNADIIFDEFGMPGLGEDHCSCGVHLDGWLDLVGQHCRSRLP
jgi:hypothetical protein